MQVVTTERPQLTVPRDAIFTVLNHFALATIVGAVKVEQFDRVINSFIAATDGALQAELGQVKLVIKRVLEKVERGINGFCH